MCGCDCYTDIADNAEFKFCICYNTDADGHLFGSVT